MKYSLEYPLFNNKDVARQQIVDSEIKKLVNKFGSPFYLFHEKDFCNNYNHLCAAFQAVYENYLPAYSYKTNYTPYVCNLIKKMGGYAEVVSDMEYTLAKKIGYKNEYIIYNGPCKGTLMEEHILAGGLSNIDNEEEAARVVAIAQENPHVIIKVGIRVNSDIGAGYVSRFGVELDSPSFSRIVSLLKQYRNIRLSGLHCHISRARGTEAWQRRIDNLLYAADIYFDDIPDYIDVGSGMFGEMDSCLAEQFDFHVPTYEEYAAIVGGAIGRHYANVQKKPILFSEPGTTVVSKYISLITTVRNIKTIGEKCFITVDSSFYNIGEICQMKKLPFRIVPISEDDQTKQLTTNKHIDIMGYTCLEQDCIYHNFRESLHVGDRIVFGNVGGYSIVSKPPFIQPNCRMLCYSPDGEIIEIKQAETFDDIFHSFVY